MTKIFVEYKIMPKHREAYFQLMEKAKQQVSDFELFEGTDQPNLFVEVWHHLQGQNFHEWKKSRLSSSLPLWSDIHAMVDGGAAKIHIWEFTKIH